MLLLISRKKEKKLRSLSDSSVWADEAPVIAGLTFPVIAGLTFHVIAGMTFPVIAGLTFPVIAGMTRNPIEEMPDRSPA